MRMDTSIVEGGEDDRGLESGLAISGGTGPADP
jgi:hypothetical protein